MPDITTPYANRIDAGEDIWLTDQPDCERRTGYAFDIQRLAGECHARAAVAGWWDKPLNFGERIALVHSEVSEALEGFRKNKQDEHLPQFKSVEVELADALIRIFDLAGAMKLDLGQALVAKLVYNQHRADHKPEARAAEGGKKF